VVQNRLARQDTPTLGAHPKSEALVDEMIGIGELADISEGDLLGKRLKKKFLR